MYSILRQRLELLEVSYKDESGYCASLLVQTWNKVDNFSILCHNKKN